MESVEPCHLINYTASYPGVIKGIKVVSALVCPISMAFAGWIIVTYLVFKNLRTVARQLLVNLSIADILVPGSHLLGAFLNYERFYTMPSLNSTDDPLCVTQGAVTMYGSIASFLWTMSIAVYFLLLTLSVRKKTRKWMVVLMYVVSWGIPLLFVIITAAMKQFGFQYTGGSVGCYTLDLINSTSETIVIELVSYEIWVYLAYILLPILYLIVFYRIRCSKTSITQNSNILAATKTDIKLLLVPISFLLLRIWTTITDIFVFYNNDNHKKMSDFPCDNASAVLLFLQTIGLNSQGTVNAILFCLLTKQVRMTWFKAIGGLCKCKHDEERENMLEETVDNSLEVTPATRRIYNSLN